jgi:hemerythrin-like domain-containing protein
MDALQMLRDDHRKVRELFRQYEDAKGPSMKKSIADTALVELNIHSVLEEEIFYPAVRRQGNGSGQIVRRAEQEHHTAEQLMDELMKMEAGNAEFDAKFHVLIESVKKHIEEEEAEMLPLAAEVGMARLEQLGKQMEQRKQELMHDTNGRSAGRTRARATTGRRRATTSGTRRKATSGTRRTTASGTRQTTASGTRRTSASGTRRTTASGTRRTTASGARASTARAKSPARTSASRARSTASRAKTTTTPAKTAAKRTVKASASRAKTTATRAKATAKRTVKTAGTRARTTKSRSNTSGRRSSSQSGR